MNIFWQKKEENYQTPRWPEMNWFSYVLNVLLIRKKTRQKLTGVI